MRRHWWQALAVMLLTMAAAAPPVEAAQESLTAVILRGASARPGSAPSGAASPLVPGVRVESPARMWTELAFADGSSIVLEPGADFTLQGFGKDPRTGHLVIRGSSGRGRLRVATSANVDVVIQTAGTEAEVVAASAVILAGPKGSAALISGKSVEVRRGDRDDVLRRPGYAIAFADGSVQRLSPQQLSEALDSFAPVAMGGGPANATLIAEAGGSTAPATAGSLTYLNPNNNIGLSAPNQSNTGGGPNVGGGGGGNVGSGGSGNVGGGAGTPLFFSLAAANIDPRYGPTSGSNIAAPGPNSSTSSINGVNNIDNTVSNPMGDAGRVGAADPPIADALIGGLDKSSANTNGGLSQFGTGRVRRFAPDSSGFTAPRSDTGVVTLPGVSTPRPINSVFQNVTSTKLNANGANTFYDSVSNVGIVSLLTLAPLTANQSNILSGFPSPGSTHDIGQYYQVGLVPRIYVADDTTPKIQYQLQGQDFSRNYLGSAVFEIGLLPGTTRDGKVSPLQGTNGVFVFRSASELPSRDVLTRIDPSFASDDPFDSSVPPAKIIADRQALEAACMSKCRTFPALVTNGTTQSSPYFGTMQTVITPDPLHNIQGLWTAESGAPADRTQLNPAPGVYIIDKITASSDAIKSERDIQPGERFFVIGGTPLPPKSSGLPGALPGTVTRFAISDGVNPTNLDNTDPAKPRGFSTGQTIEQQFIAPGFPNQPAAFNQYNAFRPEETFVPFAARGDTDLLVVSDQSARNPAMRADLQITGDGRSSASASVGGIGTIADTHGNPTLALSGATVGSAQLDTNRAALSIKSNLGSLGTADDGVGAHMFPGSDKAPNQIGYFAVSQADTRLGAPGTDAGVQPGTIQTVGNSSPSGTSQFAYTRLATNVGPPPGLLPSGPLDAAGFATAVVQSFTNSQGAIYAISSQGPDGVSIKSNASNTEFTATLNMTSTSVGFRSSDPQAAPAPTNVPAAHTLNFGGNPSGPPTSAVISPATFAAVIPGQAAMASVDGDLLSGIANRTGPGVTDPTTGAFVNADIPASNEHLAWGFFLGDLAEKANGQQQNNVNLGFWVAGRLVPASVMQSLTGTATYGGGLIGTAVDNNGARTATGNFAQFWDFGARKGSMNANFDSRAWAGLQSSMPAGSNVFTGSGMSGDRVMSVQGAFFHNTATGGALSSSNLPAAIGGIFAVQGPAYGANGIMVGRR